MNAACDEFFVAPEQTLYEVLEVIDRGAKGIALVVAGGALVGTATDGDIRRAVLEGMGLDSPVGALLLRRAGKIPAPTVTAPADAPKAMLSRIMHAAQLKHLPLVNDAGVVVGVVRLDELLPDEPPPVHAVVMAGGRGSRLRPLTEDTPKPMLPVGDRPLIEHLVRKLQNAGVRRMTISTGYLAEQITEHFGDGRDFGLEIQYTTEGLPLGTAGSLGTLNPPPACTTLVVNGDIHTNLSFEALFAYHREQQADLTLGVRQFDFRVPYGVVEIENGLVTGISEKPSLTLSVSAGIYLLEPVVYEHIAAGEQIDMPDLILRLLGSGMTICSFPIIEYWMDVGTVEDYRNAQRDAEKGE